MMLFATGSKGEPILDEKWNDGSRAESHRPDEAAIWTGRPADITVAKGALSTKLGNASQKIWTYFTDKDPVILIPGQSLIASVSFIPRVAIADTTSRSLRIGLFYDPTSPRVEGDVNNDGGGPDNPWSDSQGYAVQLLVTGGEFSSTKPFDIGKRVNMASPSLLGTSGDFAKLSGGTPVTLKLDTEYRVTLEVQKIADSQVDIVATLYQGDEQLSTWSVTDNGSSLGTAPICDKFDQLFIRVANNSTSADQIDFTNFKVEVIAAK